MDEASLLRPPRHAANWALGALFNGCPRLTKLDLSHCPKLTDDDVRVPGDSCHELQHTYPIAPSWRSRAKPPELLFG